METLMKAHIRPGYIIMREGQYLEEQYRNETQCGYPGLPKCPTFHSDWFSFSMISSRSELNKTENFSSAVTGFPLGQTT